MHGRGTDEGKGKDTGNDKDHDKDKAKPKVWSMYEARLLRSRKGST